jgi:hypothetical protein
MPQRPDQMYAQLPVFKYQTFDRESLSFSDVPIIPPSTKPPIESAPEDNNDADDGPKDGEAQMEEVIIDGAPEGAGELAQVIMVCQC